MPTHSYKNPQSYSKNNSLQYEFAMKVISKAKSIIDKRARILDIGCGDGVITSELAKIANESNVI